MPETKDDFAQIIEIMSGVKAHIEKTLTKPEQQHHMLKLTSDLQRNIEYISLITGAGDVSMEVPKAGLQPVTTIAGRPVRFTGKKKDFDVTPEESAVTDLQGRVDMIYPSFIEMDSKDIRKNVKEIVIRGVAKKAKMAGVTKDNPAVIDIAFIDKIKIQIAADEQFQKEQAEAKEAADLSEAFKEPGAGPDDVPDAIGDIEKMKDEITGDGTGQALPPVPQGGPAEGGAMFYPDNKQTKAKTGKAK